MNKQCARCSKTVYPLEELKCLDKTWHKGCFKCWECGMTLNMKTYKGFNKFPYCEAHIPKPKATTVAETPELQRIAENTKIQSNVQYHADFEKSKGRYTTVADDPETVRIKEASKIISNVSYHGELQKKADMESRRALAGDDDARNGNAVGAVYAGDAGSAGSRSSSKGAGSRSSPAADVRGDDDFAAKSGSRAANAAQRGAVAAAAAHNAHRVPVTVQSAAGPQRQVGSISDYDPMRMEQSSSSGRSYQIQVQQQQKHRSGSSQSRSGAPQLPGGHTSAAMVGSQLHAQQQQQHRSQASRGSVGGSAPGSKVPQNLGRCYRAIYDYSASDTDEVSFKEGDLIIHCSPIEEGWMTGTVQRTARTGMLPANYVQPVN